MRSSFFLHNKEQVRRQLLVLFQQLSYGRMLAYLFCDSFFLPFIISRALNIKVTFKGRKKGQLGINSLLIFFSPDREFISILRIPSSTFSLNFIVQNWIRQPVSCKGKLEKRTCKFFLQGKKVGSEQGIGSLERTSWQLTNRCYMQISQLF